MMESRESRNVSDKEILEPAREDVIVSCGVGMLSLCSSLGRLGDTAEGWHRSVVKARPISNQMVGRSGGIQDLDLAYSHG